MELIRHRLRRSRLLHRLRHLLYLTPRRYAIREQGRHDGNVIQEDLKASDPSDVKPRLGTRRVFGALLLGEDDGGVLTAPVSRSGG